MMIIFAALAALILLAWRYYYRKNWSRQIRFSLKFGSEAVRAGEPVTLSEIVENRKKLPVPILEAGFRVPVGLRFLDGENIVRSDYLYKRDVFAMLGMECITRKYHLLCQKRGRYPVSQMTLNCRSLLHFDEYYREIACDDILYVYARGTDIRGILPSLISVIGERDANRRIIEDPFAFAGIRPYTPSDPMKNINWKASAKGSGMMVNSYQSVMADQALILLDLEDRRIIKRSDLVEECISLAASLSRWLIRNRWSVGIAVNVVTEDADGFFGIESALGEEQLSRIERMLTLDISSAVYIPFGQMCEQVLSRDHEFMPVLISINTDETAVKSLRAACKDETGAIWVCPCFKEDEPPRTPLGALLWIRREVTP